MKNEIQKAIDQVGQDAIQRYLPKGMKLNPCAIHGHYLTHYTDSLAVCPLCIKTGTGEGVTATQVEHWINLKDSVQAMTGFRPQG